MILKVKADKYSFFGKITDLILTLLVCVGLGYVLTFNPNYLNDGSYKLSIYVYLIAMIPEFIFLINYTLVFMNYNNRVDLVEDEQTSDEHLTLDGEKIESYQIERLIRVKGRRKVDNKKAFLPWDYFHYDLLILNDGTILLITFFSFLDLEEVLQVKVDKELKLKFPLITKKNIEKALEL